MEGGSTKFPVKFMKRKESLIPASFFGDSPATFDALRLILSLPASQRSHAQVETLIAYTKHLKVFADMRDEISTEAHFQCCQQLTHASKSAGEFVFHENDEGTQFFIILMGSCAVVSKAENAEGKQDYKQLTVLRQGECFGELALISHLPRAAGILCREDSHFAVLERDDYNRILAKIQDHQLQTKVELLQRHPVFAKWTKTSLQRLSYFFKIHRYKRKHVLFTSYTPVTEVFFIKTGDFQLTKDVQLGQTSLPSLKNPRSHVDVTVVSVGEIMGAKEAIEGGVFSYTCTCSSSRGEAMVIQKEDFKQVMVSEETVDYLLSMNREKEKYRENRLKAAVEIECAKRKAQSQKAGEALLSTSRSMVLLRNDLMRGKSGIYGPEFDQLLDSPRRKPLETQTLRLGNSSAVWMDAPQNKGKPAHSPTKSWGEIFISKYALRRPAHQTERKDSLERSPHAKARNDINIRFKQLQFMMNSAEHSKSSLLAKGALLTFGSKLSMTSPKFGHAKG